MDPEFVIYISYDRMLFFIIETSVAGPTATWKTVPCEIRYDSHQGT